MKKPPRKRAPQARPASAPAAPAETAGLFERIVTILEEARARVVRSVNSEMVLAYWHIGREIVESVQSGQQRAEYGEALLETLSAALGRRLGRGFSVANLRYFRLFYLAYADRRPSIHHEARDESHALPASIHHEARDESHALSASSHHEAGDVSVDLARAMVPANAPRGFSSRLSWTHYRVDLKMGKLTHQDVGQMDSYVRL